MKAASFHGIDDIRCEETDTPRIGDGEVLLRVRVCGLCGTDVSKMRRGTVATPAVLGHEVAGDVAEVGRGVEGVEVGERIIVTHHLPCFVCRYCRHGSYSQCETFKKMNIVPGGFAEYVRILQPAVEKSVMKIPAHLSYEEACFAETIGCCLRALERCAIRPGDSVMVVGAGPVGLLHLQLVRNLGAGQVIVSDLVDFRLDMALKLGADIVINSAKDDVGRVVSEKTGGGADVVIVTVGNADALCQSLKLVSRGGKVLFFAGCPPDSVLSFDPNLVYHSEVTLLGSYSSTPVEQRTALELIEKGRIRVKELITHRFRLHELSEAVALAVQARDSLKIVIGI
jgi:L-iditol 2-dehydrogenase